MMRVKFCGLSRVLTSLILEASFAVSIGSQFLGKAPDSGITEDFGVNTIFLEDLAHGFAVDELAVCHALEFRGEFDPSGDDTGYKRAFTKLSDFFGVKLFFSHSAPFCLEFVSTIIADPSLCGTVHSTGVAIEVLWNWNVHGLGFLEIGTVHRLGMSPEIDCP